MKYTIENPSSLTPKQLKRKQGRIATKIFSNSFLGIVLYFLLGSLVMAAITIAIELIIPDQELAITIYSSGTFQLLLQLVGMYGIALPAFFLFIRPIPKRNVTERDISFADFMRMFFISMFLIRVGNVISEVINNVLNLGIQSTSFVGSTVAENLLSIPNIVTVIVVVIVGPIAEELIFRKALIDRLGKYGEKMALVISSVAFGIFHGNFNQLFYATFVGFIFGFLYIKTGQIRYSCIMHMLINLFGTAPSILIEAFVPDTLNTEDLNDIISSGELDGAIIVYLAATLIVLILSTAGFISLCSAKKTGVFRYQFRTDIQLSPIRKFRCALLNIGVILFLVLCVNSFITYYEILAIA